MATNFWPKWAKNHKNSYTFSCMQRIRAEYDFETGFMPSGNSSVTLPYTRDEGALPWATNFGTKIAINAHKRISVTLPYTTDNGRLLWKPILGLK